MVTSRNKRLIGIVASIATITLALLLSITIPASSSAIPSGFTEVDSTTVVMPFETSQSTLYLNNSPTSERDFAINHDAFPFNISLGRLNFTIVDAFQDATANHVIIEHNDLQGDMTISGTTSQGVVTSAGNLYLTNADFPNREGDYRKSDGQPFYGLEQVTIVLANRTGMSFSLTEPVANVAGLGISPLMVIGSIGIIGGGVVFGKRLKTKGKGKSKGQNKKKPFGVLVLGLFMFSTLFAYTPTTAWETRATIPSIFTLGQAACGTSDGVGNIWVMDGLAGPDAGGNPSFGDSIQIWKYDTGTDVWSNQGLIPALAPTIVGPMFDPFCGAATYSGTDIYVTVKPLTGGASGEFMVYKFSTASPVATWTAVTPITIAQVGPPGVITDLHYKAIEIDSSLNLYSTGGHLGLDQGNLIKFFSASAYAGGVPGPNTDYISHAASSDLILLDRGAGEKIWYGGRDVTAGLNKWFVYDIVGNFHTTLTPPVSVSLGRAEMTFGGPPGDENIIALDGNVFLTYDPDTNLWDETIPNLPVSAYYCDGDNPDGQIYAGWANGSVGNGRFDILAIALDVPSLLTPLNGQTGFDDIGLSFSWTASIGATSYRVQIDDDPAFGSPDEFTTPLITTVLGPFVTDSYNWRVRAEAGANVSAYSTSRAFDIIARPPGNGAGIIIPPEVIVPDLTALSITEAISTLPAGIVGAIASVGSVSIFGFNVYIVAIILGAIGITFLYLILTNRLFG